MSFQLVANGLGGTCLDLLLEHRCDPGVLRPWKYVNQFGKHRGNYYTVTKRNYAGEVVYKRDKTGSVVLNSLGKPVPDTVDLPFNQLVYNAPVTLRREDWLRIDEDVEFDAKQPLRVWADLRGTVPLIVPDGYATPAIQHAVGDVNGVATIGMNPVRRAERFRPTLDTAITPLPCIWADGNFDSRDMAVSRRGGMPLDSTTIRGGARAVSEVVEGIARGSQSFTWGGGSLYGLLNHPNRFTDTLTTPDGTNGNTVITEIVNGLRDLQTNNFNGPYVAYYSPNYVPWFTLDFTTNYPKTLFDRIKESVPQIGAWRLLEQLTGYQIVIVQMTPDVIQAVEGMAPTTVQWNTEGGFEWHFKYLTIQVTRVRANAAGKTGVWHGSV